MKDFHCCATCIHFKSEKVKTGMRYKCNRLNFQTEPSYKFNCWHPKENVQKLMEKQKDKTNKHTNML